MKKIFLNIYSYLNRHKAMMWGLLALLTVLCLLSALRINFVEDISSFLPNNKENERINYAYGHIGTANKIMVNIASVASTSSETDATEEL